MSNDVRYFVWRDGRPRWNPGPGLREAGWRGRDLKDGSTGAYLPLGPALDMARALNEKAGVEPRKRGAGPHGGRPKRALRERKLQGYVYFLWVGNHIKIGFSAVPTHRLRSLLVGAADPVKVFASIAATKLDEHGLHYLLRAHRLEGEWFKDVWAVRKVMLRCLGRGTCEVAFNPQVPSGRQQSVIGFGHTCDPGAHDLPAVEVTETQQEPSHATAVWSHEVANS